MAINLELPQKLAPVTEQAHLAAEHIFRPISRTYDKAEHTYPEELDELGKLAREAARKGRESDAADKSSAKKSDVVNGGNVRAVLHGVEMGWGDVALMLSIPYQGLGNAAIAAVANPEQLEKFKDVWASMAITEPSFGSDSAAVSTTATLDGDEYVINGEKIFVTAGSRADHVVVWATVDKSAGRAAIKSFVVPMDTEGVSVVRLEHKLGIKGSPTGSPSMAAKCGTPTAPPRRQSSHVRLSWVAPARSASDCRYPVGISPSSEPTDYPLPREKPVS